MTTPTTPTGVRLLTQAAVQRGLLDDAGSLASGLQSAGWRRDTQGGWWVYDEDPAWSLGSAVDPASFSIFATGPDDLVAEAADQIAFHLIASETRGLTTGGTDDLGVRTWQGAAVEVELYFDPTRTVDLPHKSIEMPCTLHLAVARRDAPRDGQAPDHVRSLRVAREGTPLQRWYLAGQEDLPDDAVQALALDADPAVAAALGAGSRQRQLWRER